jgi:GNAT superfamily N-acetyltransferase
LFDQNDIDGTHIGVYDNHGTLLGATHIMLAERSDFGAHTGFGTAALEHAVLSSRTSVAPEARNKGVFSLLIYVAMRWARQNGRTFAVGFMEEGEPPIKKMLGCEPILGVSPREVLGSDGKKYRVIAAHGSVDLWAQRAFNFMPRMMRSFVCANLMPEELVSSARRVISSFYDNPWFGCTYAGTLTRNQYGRAIANLHQYVRWTTRLLAQVTGQTHDRDLRAHFLDHLSGEIDHERMLEADLKAIGWDVDWVMNEMAPDPEILSFMAIQQSLVAFERDPVLFLMVPLVAEGLSAFMDQSFIDALEQCVRSWGIDNPRSATKFLRSHIHTDGGEDGHWAAVEGMLKGRIQDEAHNQRALSIIHAIGGAMNRAYANYVQLPDFGYASGARPSFAHMPFARGPQIEPAHFH